MKNLKLQISNIIRTSVFYFLLSTFHFSLFTSCQKDIEISLPEPKIKIVVDGKIEPGLPPYVILTHNKAYFGHVDLNNMQEMFIHDAVIKVSNGTNTVTLTEICSKSLPDSLLPIVSEFTGINPLLLKQFNYCIYTTLDPSFYGQFGKTYSLLIIADGKTLTSSTSILPPVPLDSLWWRVVKDDSLGFIWSHLTDPPAEGNNYRWLAKRLGRDNTFLSATGSAFEDKFVNGQSFDFAEGYFNKGDTVVIKFCSIDYASFDFYRKLDVVTNSQGNPFAAPSSVPSNIYPQSEVLGIWCGNGFVLDTIVCK